MRQIEFRGKGVNGEWHFGNLTILKRKVGRVEAGCYISNAMGMPFAYHVRPETIGQFTEKKCRNKKEIYDGDIVETDSKKKLLVYWSNKEFAWKIKVFPQIWLGNKLTEIEDYFFHEYKDFAKYKDSSDVLDNLQIIGNRYDNPELLEEK